MLITSRLPTLAKLFDVMVTLQNTFANDIIPGESYVLAVVNAHILSLSSQQTFTINPSLKHLLHSLVTFISEHIM